MLGGFGAGGFLARFRAVLGIQPERVVCRPEATRIFVFGDDRLQERGQVLRRCRFQIHDAFGKRIARRMILDEDFEYRFQIGRAEFQHLVQHRGHDTLGRFRLREAGESLGIKVHQRTPLVGQ